MKQRVDSQAQPTSDGNTNEDATNTLLLQETRSRPLLGLLLIGIDLSLTSPLLGLGGLKTAILSSVNELGTKASSSSW